MVNALGAGNVATIDAAHLAMLSKPAELVAIVTSLVA
jgi:hypothetical protein